MVSWEKIADIVADARKRGIAMAVRDIPFEGMTRDFVREQVDVFNAERSSIGCVFFRSQTETTSLAIIFAGWSEHFAMLSVARGLSCNVLYFQESHDFWYTGSELLPRIDHIGGFLNYNFSTMNCVFFGQSSGAYASLASSKFMKNAVVIAISPQTFADSTLKERVKFSGLLNIVSSPDALIDLSSYLRDGPCLKRYIFVSASESRNPFERHMWLDHIHAFRMIDIQNLEILMVRAYQHSLVFRNSDVFSSLIGSILSDPVNASEHAWGASEILSVRALAQRDADIANTMGVGIP